MKSVKPVVSGEEIIRESDDVEVKEANFSNGIIFKNIFLKDSIRGKLVVDRSWLVKQLNNFPRLGDVSPDTSTLVDYRRDKWKEDFEGKLLGEEQQ